MEIIRWLGVPISEALQDLKTNEADISYDKIEGDEFIKVPEKGYYLHAIEGQGIISDIRIYIEERDNFFRSTVGSRGKYGILETLIDAEKEFGPSIKEIRVFAFPGVPPTLPGKMFKDGKRVISVFSENGEDITYIHIKEKA